MIERSKETWGFFLFIVLWLLKVILSARYHLSVHYFEYSLHNSLFEAQQNKQGF